MRYTHPDQIIAAATTVANRKTEAHVIRGLSYWLAQGSITKHPLELVQTLGMSRNSCWWKGYAEPWSTDQATCQVFFEFVGREWTGQLLDLVQNMHMAFSIVSAIPDGRQQAVMLKLLHYSKFVYPSCFSTVERLVTMANEDVRHLPPDVVSRLDHSLAALQAALDNKDPMMAAHLQNSHSLIQSYPEAVHLLTDDKIKLLIGAAQQHTKTEIIAKAAAGKGAATKRKIGVDDL